MIITGIHPQSPFHEAGFVVGYDMIAVAGAPVSTPAELLYRLFVAVLSRSPQITRVTSRGSVSSGVDLISALDLPKRTITEFDEQSFFPDLIVSSINPTVVAELNLPWGSKGFIVSESGYIAASIRIRQEDILHSANNQNLMKVEDVDAILSCGERRGILLAQRGAQKVSLRFRL